MQAAITIESWAARGVDVILRMVGARADEDAPAAEAALDVDATCATNCSNRGICINGSCYCQIQYEGSECRRINLAYHVAFASIFFFLAMTSLIQLVMCIHAEYLRMKKNPSIIKALRITTQKLLYFLVFLAAILRGTYFAAPTIGVEWSMGLMSAFYPVVLTGLSLLVCFWAEVFHLREVRWDRPRFLSKSFLGFLTFNVITYALLIIELLLVWIEHEDREFYKNIFNGCYAILMFIVVIFFLIYGVEVFFKIRGGFTVPRVSGVIGSTRGHAAWPGTKSARETEAQKGGSAKAKAATEVVTENLLPKELHSESMIDPLVRQSQSIDSSQLHQSRLGLLSQALMMMATIGFLFSETLEQFWKYKVDLSSRNMHDVIFRTVEIGVALWFPCVLWNCIRPEQLWCLNPKKILGNLQPLTQPGRNQEAPVSAASSTTDEDEEKGPECWICYDSDRTDAGPMIHPCNCRGDVGAVHHDCLRRWLVESADNPDALKCKVCNEDYMVEKSSQFSLSHGFTVRQWITTVTMVTIMCFTLGGCWAVIQIYSEAWIRMLAVGSALLVQYICLRSLGLSTVTAYNRAKVFSLHIVNLGGRRQPAEAEAAGPNLHSFGPLPQTQSRL